MYEQHTLTGTQWVDNTWELCMDLHPFSCSLLAVYVCFTFCFRVSLGLFRSTSCFFSQGYKYREIFPPLNNKGGGERCSQRVSPQLKKTSHFDLNAAGRRDFSALTLQNEIVECKWDGEASESWIIAVWDKYLKLVDFYVTCNYTVLLRNGRNANLEHFSW